MMNVTGAFLLQMVQIFTAYSSFIGRLLAASCSPIVRLQAKNTRIEAD